MKTTGILLLAFLVPMALFAKNPLEVGSDAPALTVTTHTGSALDLAEAYSRGPVLIFFYPKADTPGCTKQACNLRDHYGDLKEAGIQVFGVSMDDVETQKAFSEKYDLPYLLVADDERELGNAFGVGSYMGMAYKRQTFLVKDGKIAWRDLSAKPATQTADALAAHEALSDGE